MNNLNSLTCDAWSRVSCDDRFFFALNWFRANLSASLCCCGFCCVKLTTAIQLIIVMYVLNGVSRPLVIHLLVTDERNKSAMKFRNWKPFFMHNGRLFSQPIRFSAFCVSVFLILCTTSMRREERGWNEVLECTFQWFYVTSHYLQNATIRRAMVMMVRIGV